MNELPAGWVEATLEQLCSFNPRHDSLIDRQIEISFVPMPAVCDREGIILPHETRFLEEVWKGYTHFQDNDVIFAKITPCMENGKIALASGLHNGLACGSTEFHVLRSLGVVLPEYLWRFIRQLDFRKEAERHMTGAVGQRRVPVQFLKETAIPVPPLNEQQRVVAKLDRLFTHSRRAREGLERVSALCNRYKQAVLASAFRGNLTADWRDNNPDMEPASELLKQIQLKQQKQVNSSHQRQKLIDFFHATTVADSRNEYLNDIPTTWSRCQIGNIGSVCNGSTPSRKLSEYWNGNISWVSSGEVRNNVISRTKETITQQGYENSSVRILPVGTVLLAMIGEGKTRGQTAILRIEATINQNVAGVIIDHGLISSEYLWYWFQYQYQSTREQGSGSGPQALNCQRVRELPFIVSPFAEQEEIVWRVEKMFKEIDLMKQEYQKASNLLDRLEQTTLSKAFRGELVPQDPKDEPAAVLLDRIQAERQEQPKTKKTSRNKKVG